MTNIVFLDSATMPFPIPLSAIGAESVNWRNLPSTPESEVVSALADADIAVTNKVKLRRETLERLPRLKYICVTASGYDCVDIDYCKEHGIQVSNVPGYGSKSVAEHVIACIFALRRHIGTYSRFATEGAWTESDVFCVHGPRIHDIGGSTLGLVGQGAIGKEVARLAKALGMHVMISERKGATMIREGYMPFDHVLSQSDVVSLHCPSTPDTIGLIGERELGLMKNSAVLINTARGALIDEPALESALNAGKIAGAALDVLQVEPPQENHRFLTSPPENLLLTPHVAWASQSAINTLANAAAANITSFLNGNTVNRIV